MKSSAKKVELAPYDDLFSTEESRQDAKLEKIQEIPLSELHPFKGHPFKVKDDEAMMETADSVRQYGVLVPAIARPDPEGGYELVAGHRRHRASELAEKETMPVIVRDLDDDAATIIMVDSNLQRESLLPSERAFAYLRRSHVLVVCGHGIDETVKNDIATAERLRITAIADFLDKECARIDSIAADLEKQIALLQQYKKSLITETVTKGLDKSVPMKDSGLEWLGKIPAHWNFKRLKFMLENSSDSMKVGPFGSALSGSDFTDEGKWVYNQRVVLDNNFSENTTFVSEEKFQEMRSFAVYPGDILITTRGTIGKVAIVPEGANEGILHPCIIKFRVDKEMIIPELLQLIFNESDFVKDQFTLMSNATTIEVIYSYSLKDILLPVIPADEQKKIYGYLSKECIAINGIIAEKQKALAIITQHKKSLIYEYVTGKKRVKEVR